MAQLQKLHTGLADRPAIIFVHGLGGHPIDTWRHDSCTEQSFWLHWVGSDTQCDVWTLEYDAALSAWQDNAMPLPDQGDQVLDLLATNTGLANKQLVLVGHSMGGLVIKTVLISGSTKGDARFEALVNRVQGVVFLATPHGGAQLANIAQWAGFVLRTNVQVGDMTLHDAHLRTLTQQFRNHADKHHLSVRSFAETRGVKIAKGVFSFIGINSGPTIVVVDQASADPGIQGSTVVRLAEDHGSICKPEGATKQVHTSVCEFLNTLPRSPSPHAPATTPTTQNSVPVSHPPNPAPAYLAPREPGRLTGPTDSRLQPREGRLYGRADDVAKVQLFLSGNDPTHPNVALVVGAAGEGKTEVCKAALKAWLASPQTGAAYYVELPDSGDLSNFVFTLGRAIGRSNVASWDQLMSRMAGIAGALFFLDNIDRVADTQDGFDALRSLARIPGVRVLASSRVGFQSVFGTPIEIRRLPDESALRLFRESWNGSDALPSDAAFHQFVLMELGAHAFSIFLVARLGQVFHFAEITRRWKDAGPFMANDGRDNSRYGSLVASLYLTSEVVATTPGSLSLWTLAALFDDGMPEDWMADFETELRAPNARRILVQHYVLRREGSRYRVQNPFADFALVAARETRMGFSWTACRAPILKRFLNLAEVANRGWSGDKLKARDSLRENYRALTRTVDQETQCATPAIEWLGQIAGEIK